MKGIASFSAVVLAMGASVYAVSASGDAPPVSFSNEAGRLFFGGLSHPGQANLDFKTLYAMSPGASPTPVRKLEGGILAVDVAPRGSLVAVLESVRRSDEILSSRLIILDARGEVRHLVSDTQAFSWEPSGRRIAYVTGTLDKHRFDSTGTWILDIQTGLTQRVYSSGMDVHWASWDSNVYIATSSQLPTPAVEVVRYEPVLKQAVETSYHGIYFSPDGKYYYTGSYHDDIGGEVFETASNRQISLAPLSKIDGSPIGIGWIGQHMLISRAPGTVSVNYIEDLESNMRTRVEGSVIPIAAEVDRIVVFNKGAAAKRNVSTLVVK